MLNIDWMPLMIGVFSKTTSKASEATATWRFTNFVLYCIVVKAGPGQTWPDLAD